ncbi:MAG: hypothetical protein H7843_13780 [Nitrospirota bacterium]
MMSVNIADFKEAELKNCIKLRHAVEILIPSKDEFGFYLEHIKHQKSIGNHAPVNCPPLPDDYSQAEILKELNTRKDRLQSGKLIDRWRYIDLHIFIEKGSILYSKYDKDNNWLKAEISWT